MVGNESRNVSPMRREREIMTEFKLVKNSTRTTIRYQNAEVSCCSWFGTIEKDGEGMGFENAPDVTPVIIQGDIDIWTGLLSIKFINTEGQWICDEIDPREFLLPNEFIAEMKQRLNNVKNMWFE